MDWLAWFASRHTWFVHLPAAAAVLVPLPILAAQRGGRGIRPWWTTCRYLAWAGVIGAVLAVLSGFLQARHLGLVPADAYWGPALPGRSYLFRVHQLGGVASLLLGLACLRSLYRQRQDHQGIGLFALLFGVLWGACALVTSYDGAYLLGRSPAPPILLGTALPGSGTRMMP
jgi:hypothetical protein